jgi:intracellular sulfur oxidation DsrE/DsrF family protein
MSHGKNKRAVAAVAAVTAVTAAKKNAFGGLERGKTASMEAVVCGRSLVYDVYSTDRLSA